MQKAWLENGVIRDVCHGNPVECYHPDIAALYTVNVPDGTVSGATKIGGVWTNPAPPPPPAPPAPPEPLPNLMQVSAVQFMLLFTPQERVAIRSAGEGEDADQLVKDFLRILDDPRVTTVDLTLQSNIDALGYLVVAELLTSQRKAVILAGLPQ